MIFIGEFLKDRMNLLNLSIEDIAEKTFIESSIVKKLQDNQYSVDDVEYFDLIMISKVLHCTPEYFFDKKVRDKDLLVGSQNRGNDDRKSINTKMAIQDFMNDLAFLDEFV